MPVVVACAVVLTSCGSSTGPASPAGSTSFQDRAADVAKAWQDAGVLTAWPRGFVPLQELTVEPAWSPNGDLKASYGNGWIRSRLLFRTPPARATYGSRTARRCPFRLLARRRHTTGSQRALATVPWPANRPRASG